MYALFGLFHLSSIFHTFMCCNYSYYNMPFLQSLFFNAVLYKLCICINVGVNECMMYVNNECPF